MVNSANIFDFLPGVEQTLEQLSIQFHLRATLIACLSSMKENAICRHTVIAGTSESLPKFVLIIDQSIAQFFG